MLCVLSHVVIYCNQVLPTLPRRICYNSYSFYRLFIPININFPLVTEFHCDNLSAEDEVRNVRPGAFNSNIYILVNYVCYFETRYWPNPTSHPQDTIYTKSRKYNI